MIVTAGLALAAVPAITATPATAATASALPAGVDRAAIIGGREATEPYSFMVSFSLPGMPEHHCGGSLVTSGWVVTAAHCKGLMKPGRTLVRVGSHDRQEGGELTGVKRVVTSRHGDLMLVRLDRKVGVAPIRIADGPGPVGEPSRVLGWGMTCDNRRDPDCADGSRRLRELDTVRVPDGRCADLAGSTELCVGERQGRAASACNGDSGGPQIRRVGGRWELVGATSRDGDDLDEPMSGSAGCSTGPSGEPGVGVWTDVTYHRRWIADVIGPAELSAATAPTTQNPATQNPAT